MIGRIAPLPHSFTLCTAVSEPAASDLVSCARIVFTICILVRIVCSTLLAAGWDCNVGIIQHDESLMWLLSWRMRLYGCMSAGAGLTCHATQHDVHVV